MQRGVSLGLKSRDETEFCCLFHGMSKSMSMSKRKSEEAANVPDIAIRLPTYHLSPFTYLDV